MNVFALLGCLATVAWIGGCSVDSQTIKGDGTIKAEPRAITEITAIEASGAFEIQWTSGAPALTVTADQNLLPHIHTEVSGETVKIFSDGSLAPTKSMQVVVSSAALARLDLTGAVHVIAKKVAAPTFALATAGATTIEVDGSASELTANLTGASRLMAAELKTKSARVTLTGASSAEVAVADALKVTITGAGSLTYSGEPKTVEQQVTGAGSIRHK